MELEEYREWIRSLKSAKIDAESERQIQKAMRFSPEKFSASKGIDAEEFKAEYQADRKALHGMLIDFEKKKKLKKRKVEEMLFFYAGEKRKARVCVCVKEMKNEVHRAKGGYKFYEGMKYNYAITKDWMDLQEIFIFDEKNMKIYTTFDAFEEHFSDLREYIIDQILKR